MSPSASLEHASAASATLDVPSPVPVSVSSRDRPEPIHRVSLIARCQRCNKPIVTYGYCYTCATGRPRTLLRPEELEESASVAA